MTGRPKISFKALDDNPQQEPEPGKQWQFTIPKRIADRVLSLGGNRDVALTLIESSVVSALGNYMHRLEKERKNGS